MCKAKLLMVKQTRERGVFCATCRLIKETVQSIDGLLPRVDFKGCSHGAIETAIYFSQLIGCMGFSVVVIIAPCEH